MDYTVIHNEAESRFEIHIEDKVSVVDYVRVGDDHLNVTHTGVPKELEGQGIAAVLTKALLDYARREGLRVRPICPYTRAYIARHSEYSDIVM